MIEPVVRCAGLERSYPQLLDRAARIAAGLHDLGVGPGDRVGIILRNELSFCEITLAAAALGASPVPVNWHFTGDDLAHVLTDSGCRVIFAHTDLLPCTSATLIEVPVPAGVAAAYGLAVPPLTGRYPVLDDWLAAYTRWDKPSAGIPQSMIYTSGTTGRPKGIMRGQASPQQRSAGLAQFQRTYRLRNGMRSLLPAPIYHTAPNSHMTNAIALGVDLTLMPRFEPEQFLRLVEEYRIQQTFMVPIMFVRLLRLPAEIRARYDLSSLEAIVHAGAPCPVHIKRQLIDWLGPIVLEYYGGSETGMVTWCDSREWLAHPGTVGRPLDTADVRIIAADGSPSPAKRDGDVYLKPHDSMPDFTYHGDDTKRRGTELDGFLTVGDIGHLDEDGFLYLSDRRRNMVISGGVNIYPAEIESCLLTLPGVLDVAVFGIPDADYGEALAAHIEADPSADLCDEDVRAHVRAHLARYKAPKIVCFEQSLPRDESGKLVTRRLQEQYWPK